MKSIFHFMEKSSQSYEPMKTNMKLVWECVFNRIQETYDLSTLLLDQLVITYRPRLDQMYQDCRTAIREQLGQFGQFGQRSWDRELCGYLVEQYINGSKKYCNVHKYEHHEIEHPFVCKDAELLQEEEHLNQRQRVYQTHLSRLGKKLYQQMEQSLLEGRILHTHSSDLVEQVDQWLRSHPTAFKLMKVIDDQIHVWIPLDISLDIENVPSTVSSTS